MIIHATNIEDGDQITFSPEDIVKLKQAVTKIINTADQATENLLPLLRLTFWLFKEDSWMAGDTPVWYGREVTDLIHNILDEDGVDYDELYFKMDKFMPEEQELMDEFNSLLNSNDDYESAVKAILIFFLSNAYIDVLANYMPENGTLQGFAKYLLSKYK